MTITRRQCAKYAAACAAASFIGLELPLPQGVEFVLEPERWIRTVCRHCEKNCAVLVRRSGRKIVAVKRERDDQRGPYPCFYGMEALMKFPGFLTGDVNFE